MISQPLFDKMFFVYQYLRDTPLKPARVDATESTFVELYINTFSPAYTEHTDGTFSCIDLQNTLKAMSGRLILERRKIALNPWLTSNRPRVTWSYSLTDYADALMSNYQDYFLNLMVRKMQRKKT